MRPQQRQIHPQRGWTARLVTVLQAIGGCLVTAAGLPSVERVQPYLRTFHSASKHVRFTWAGHGNESRNRTPARAGSKNHHANRADARPSLPFTSPVFSVSVRKSAAFAVTAAPGATLASAAIASIFEFKAATFASSSLASDSTCSCTLSESLRPIMLTAICHSPLHCMNALRPARFARPRLRIESLCNSVSDFLRLPVWSYSPSSRSLDRSRTVAPGSKKFVVIPVFIRSPGCVLSIAPPPIPLGLPCLLSSAISPRMARLTSA